MTYNQSVKIQWASCTLVVPQTLGCLRVLCLLSMLYKVGLELLTLFNCNCQGLGMMRKFVCLFSEQRYLMQIHDIVAYFAIMDSCVSGIKIGSYTLVKAMIKLAECSLDGIRADCNLLVHLWCTRWLQMPATIVIGCRCQLLITADKLYS